MQLQFEAGGAFSSDDYPQTVTTVWRQIASPGAQPVAMQLGLTTQSLLRNV